MVSFGETKQDLGKHSQIHFTLRIQSDSCLSYFKHITSVHVLQRQERLWTFWEWSKLCYDELWVLKKRDYSYISFAACSVFQTWASRLRTPESCTELYERYCRPHQREEEKDGEYGEAHGLAGICSGLAGTWMNSWTIHVIIFFTSCCVSTIPTGHRLMCWSLQVLHRKENDFIFQLVHCRDQIWLTRVQSWFTAMKLSKSTQMAGLKKEYSSCLITRSSTVRRWEVSKSQEKTSLSNHWF